MNKESFRTRYDDFLLNEYTALRSEILGIKDRLVKLQTTGITGIPIVIATGQHFDISSILLAAPLITLVFLFMVIFEQNSLMRAGAYIKLHIEEKFKYEDSLGWERWLEIHPNGRTAEFFFALSVHIAFSIYFVLSLYFSYDAIKGLTHGNESLALAIVCVYSSGFAPALYVVIKNFPLGTTRFETTPIKT
ncbi:MAG: hypothetical protein NTX45_09840 [Proteobacteria bacterium]|nr:hypothetical protein [Pseudomonadota bacterium]